MIYFDNAATSYPKPEEVYEGLNYAMRELGANPGRSGHSMALGLSREIYKTRNKIKDLINAKKSKEIIFTSNCTESLNIVIKGILEKGDHVVTTSLEHNSVLRPLNRLVDEGIITVSIVNSVNGCIRPEDIDKSLQNNTKLVITNHISNVTGSIVDIKSIGKLLVNRNIYYLVDGAQSLGVYPIDVDKMNIDFLGFPGHKSLFGPQGTGGLYIREGIQVKSLKEGGTGSLSESFKQPLDMPDRFESGTLNGPGIVALGRGIDFINNESMDKIRFKEEKLTEYFIDNIKDIKGIKIYGHDSNCYGPVVSINIKEVGSSEIAYLLDDKFDIGVRSGIHCAPLVHDDIGSFNQGTVRFSFGYYNTYEEIDKAVEALEEIVSYY